MTAHTVNAMIAFVEAVEQMAEALEQERDLRVAYRNVVGEACKGLKASLNHEPTDQHPTLT